MKTKFFRNAVGWTRFLTLLVSLVLTCAYAWGTTVSVVPGTYTKQTNVEVTGNGSYIFMFGSSSSAHVMGNSTSGSNYLYTSAEYTSLPNSITITTSPASNTNYFWSVTDYNSQTGTFKLCGPHGYCYCQASGKLAANENSSSTWHIGTTSNVIYMIDSSNDYVKYTGNSGFRAYSTATNRTQLVAVYKLNDCTSPDEALTITSSSSATVGTPLSLTTSGGNGGGITWSVTNGTGSATIDGATLTPTGAGTVTVTATQGTNTVSGTTYCGSTPTQVITITRAVANITLSEAGATSSVSGTYYGGDSYTLPSSTEASCGSKVLVGWSTVTVAETNTKPSSNYYDKGSSVTLAAGENKFYAVFATASGGGTATWTSTTLASLTGSDIFVISNGSYAMTNNNGISSAPAVASITVSNGKITSTVNDNMKWNISGNSTDGYVFYPNGSTTTWLYCNTTASSSSNNNIRVGSGDRKLWVPDNSGYLVTNDNYTDRYLSIYNSQDFRGYTGTGNGAFVPQIFKYSAGTTYSAYSTSCSSTAKTITIVPVAGGTVTTSPSGSAEAGNTVTITLTPDAHYTVGGAPTVVDANSQSVAVSGSGTSYTFTMPNANVTITPATWNPINVTITWHRKTGNTPQVVQEGKSDLTFPNTTDVDADCAPFLGWIEGTSWTDSQDEPATYYEVGDLVPAVNTNIDYTAIYGERETTETAAYVKVTSAPVDWSGDYLIVREIGGEYYVAFDGSLTTLDVNNNYVNVSASGGAIAATNALAAKKWTIAKIGATSDYSIKSASGYYIGCTGTGNGLNSSTSTVYSNTLSYSTDHTVITSSGGPVLQTYNSSRFRYYASSQGAIQLYKLGTAEMETVTYTKNPACTPKYRITVNSVTGGSPSSDKSLEPAGETITLTANTADGYSFAGWTLTHTEGGAAASVTYTTGSASTETAAFTMPAYDVTVTAAYSKKTVTELKVMDGSTVVANTTGSVSGTLNVSTGANKTLDVVITPSDAYDHSWTASVTAGGTYASISNVTSDGFRVNGLSQGDATVTVTAPNNGSAKVVTFTVHVTDVLPTEIILKLDGSETPIDALTIYLDQYAKINVSYSPTPTNKAFTFSSADATSVSSRAHAPASGYETLHGLKVTSSPVNCTFTSATGSVTKVLAVTVLALPADQFIDYIHGNATVTRAAQVSADHWSINTSITTPTLSDAAESASADCEEGHYHLIGWLPQSIAEALFAAGTPITSATEGLVAAGAEIEASGITWYAIWAKKE